MSTSLLARTGRHRQRYENNVRLVSGCIPYRLTKENHDHQQQQPTNVLQNRIQVLMVSSPNRTDLVFPKGGWEDDETIQEAACREALEEAGVRGILKETHLGVWHFGSKSSVEGGCKGYMFALEVTEELETWPEQQLHERKWLSINEAYELCRYEWMREALEKFVRVMGDGMKPEIMETCCGGGSGGGSSSMVADVVVESSPVLISATNKCYRKSSKWHNNSILLGNSSQEIVIDT